MAALRGEFSDLRLLVLGRVEVDESFRPWAVAAGVDDMVVTPGWLVLRHGSFHAEFARFDPQPICHTAFATELPFI